jgi:hypothetical protein
VVGDLTTDGVSVSMARANDQVRAQLSTFSDKALRHVRLFDSVDAAASHALDHSKG